MSDFPTTRLSLLAKVADRDDRQAWDEFVAIYRPVIYRFGRRRGLQEADASDLVQTVLAAVVEQIPAWKPDAHRAKFRTWLTRIAHNQAISMYRRRRVDTARGGSGMVAELNAYPAEEDEDARELALQYRREVFRHAARQVRQQFEETTWQAFWQTTVEGNSVAEVAKSLGCSRGSIYTARSRVIHRLQEVVRRMQLDDPDLIAEPSLTGEAI